MCESRIKAADRIPQSMPSSLCKHNITNTSQRSSSLHPCALPVNNSSRNMKLTAILCAFLLLALVVLVPESVSAQRCSFRRPGERRRRRGLCVPRFVCPRGVAFRQPNSACPGGTGCCNRSNFRCTGTGGRRGFVVPSRFCRRGNDLGPIGGGAPRSIRCCRNNIPR